MSATDMTTEEKFNSLLSDSQAIIDQAQRDAYRSVNILLIKRNWLLGKRIAEEELGGDERAEYGKRIISNLADRLTATNGEGFDRTNLYRYMDFSRMYSNLFRIDNEGIGIVGTLCQQSDIYKNLIPTRPIGITWSHYRKLLQVESPDARAWYEDEAAKQTWGVRTLQRNISSQYYNRLLQSPSKDKVEAEMKSLTAPYLDKLEYMKNPVVAEFLGFHNNTDYTESDLVFYNYLLKCFVLIDLKTTKVDYQDTGQMKMYVSMYDEKYRTEGDNPTIGILLCADTDEDVARYSSLHDDDQLYMAKYLTYMPSQEQMKREIEQQKMVFALKSEK